ncbi:hypothetical protein Hrubri_1615 [Herbaspirillum rubrisubalbicans M1]|uniref:hypothetical protein n=1 Tax=Herbaspirillum rubrisubalbicans TaxID=80842 RepID=UPI00073A0127|nr:hypothetical protein [Herbaspirillum rubrisubalbicans]ALU88823.1 hypothetical protein Hrubri_1615 [Herbaspirillum rubrisubalbicans M1]
MHPALTEPTTTQTLTLRPGQHLQVWLAAGSQLICQAPLVRVTESARWQQDQLVSRQSRLSDGECLVLPHDGWVGVLAPQGGQLLCLQPLPRPWYAPLSTLLTRLVRARKTWTLGQSR